MDLKEIQNLIKFVAKSGASEVKIEMEDIKLTIRTGNHQTAETTVVQQIPMAAPQVLPVAPAPSAETANGNPEKDEDAQYTIIKSPIIGTFYRKPSPDKPSFVEVGTVVNKGDVLCVIEAMKLFNEIEAEISGKIMKVLVDDASPVEFEQPLFLIDPS